MDPIKTAQNAFNSTAQWAGQTEARQDSANGLRHTSTDSATLDAIRSENKKNDAHSAELQKIQGEANRNVQSQDVASAISSAQQASSGKAISSAAQNAKAINY